VRYLIKWLIVALVLGMTGALTVYVYQGAIDLLNRLTDTQQFTYLMPALGGLLIGLTLLRLEPEAHGEGVPGYLKCVNRNAGEISPRTTSVYLLASILTLGLWGSGGYVGPMTMVGCGTASALLRATGPALRLISFRSNDYRIGVICGAAACLGALFHAPIGGGLFAVEILYISSIEYSAALPAIFSSLFGAQFHRYLLGSQQPLLRFEEVNFTAGQFAPVLATTLLVTLAGLIFVHSYRQFGRLAAHAVHDTRWRPCLGGLACGLVAMIVGREVLGPGQALVGLLHTHTPGTVSAATLAALAAGKLLSTVSTVGAGGSGGLTLPVIIIGGLLGRLCAVGIFDAGDTSLAGVCMVAGVAGMLASVLNVPIASIVLCIELFGDGAAIPAILGSLVAFSITRPEVVYDYTYQETAATARYDQRYPTRRSD